MSLTSPNHSDFTQLAQWIGRTIAEQDRLSAFPLRGLSALLDYSSPPWPVAELPPLAHWLYFLPTCRESDLGGDGHPKRGGFLPPVPFERRMWASGDLHFYAPLTLDAKVEKKSTIRDIQVKDGSTGRLVFVKIHHEVQQNGSVYIDEIQNIVYREASSVTPPTKATQSLTRLLAADLREAVTTSSTMLFRFSALTFNAHRIHYDESYARAEEGYQDRIAHGPLLATLLADFFYRVAPTQRVIRFSFRALKPLFVNQPIDLCLRWTDNGAELWIEDDKGQITMNVTIESE